LAIFLIASYIESVLGVNLEAIFVIEKIHFYFLISISIIVLVSFAHTCS